MHNITSAAQTVWQAINSTTTACFAAAVGCGFWIYEKLITDPLRIFYFVGPVWGAIPQEEICAQLTKVPAGWWLESPDRMQQCKDLTEQRFHSWDAGIMTSVYFAILTFVLLQFTCNCCFLRPLLREIRGSRQPEHH